ncbi:MAG: AraC family transcriptional regulator [Chitinophagaceae bacterium]|nr:MAG: AraC family transcriptional regulator [Chitinophagaceae bacterium]
MISREAIEHEVNTVYKSTATNSLSLKEPGLVDLEVQVRELKGAFIFTNTIQTHDRDLYFDLERTEPLVMMYFQLQGSAHFVDNKPFKVLPMHHSINHVPLFRSRCVAEKNTFSKNLCIKIRPAVLLREWPDELSGDRWLRAVEAGEPMITLHKSRPMNYTIQQNVKQLLDCPYSGQLGSYVKESIIRLLLIQQLAEFADESGPGNGQQALLINQPAKLTTSDVAALQDLRQYLEQHFLEDVSLDKLARRAGLNSFKLKHGFRTLFKTSVMRFIDEKKMNYAKQLLLAHDDSTDRFDLSDLLGYNHYSNFSAAFKKHFGHSPSMYRKHFSDKKYLSHIN